MRAIMASVPPWTDYLTRRRQPYPPPFPGQAGPLAASVESGDPTSKQFWYREWIRGLDARL